jgi:hypothetical protein
MKARDALIRVGPQSHGSVFGYTSSGLKSTWRFMTKKLKIEDLHFHDARHESISRLCERGVFDLMEVAAISGHKSLSMLKHYTHLRAQRLVRKLDAGTNKGKAVILSHLIPYPATIENIDNNVQVRFLDFDDLNAYGVCPETAIRNAQDVLLRRIMILMRESKSIPQSDQYLDLIDERKLIMVDPLGETA